MSTHQSLPKPANAKKKSDILPIPAQSKSHPVIAQPKIESTLSNEEQLAQMRAQREASERLGSTLLTPESVPRTLPPLQPKLTIGQPGDQYEQEADRVARQVVDHINAPPKIQAKTPRYPMSVGERKPSPLDHHPAMTVQRYATGGEMDASPDLESSIQRARGGGQPLESNLQTATTSELKIGAVGDRYEQEADVMGNNPALRQEASPDERKEAAKNKFISLMKAKNSMSREEIEGVLVNLKTEFQLSDVKLEGELPSPKIGFYASPATFLPLSGLVSNLVRLFQPNKYHIDGKKPKAAGRPSVQKGDYIRATHYDGHFPSPGKQVVDAFNNRFKGKHTPKKSIAKPHFSKKSKSNAGGAIKLYPVRAIGSHTLNLRTSKDGNTYRRAGSVEAQSSVIRGKGRSGKGETIFGHFGADEEKIKTGTNKTNYNGGHLIGDQIMDSHHAFNLYEDWNLVPQQRTFNSPVYTGTIENTVTKAIATGAAIKYTVTVQYPDDTYQIKPSTLVQNLLPKHDGYRQEVEGAIGYDTKLDAPFTLRRRTPGFWQATAEVVNGGNTINSGKIKMRQNVAFENNPVNVKANQNYNPVGFEQVRYSLEIDQGKGAGFQAQKGPTPKNPITYVGATKVKETARQKTF